MTIWSLAVWARKSELYYLSFLIMITPLTILSECFTHKRFKNCTIVQTMNTAVSCQYLFT